MAKEIPILFSTPMVKAILEGRKTRTRRIVKPQPGDCSESHKAYKEADWKNEPLTPSKTALKQGLFYCELCGNGVENSKDFAGIRCPYGKPGDLLYVRETFACEYKHGKWIAFYKADPGLNVDLSGDDIKWKPSVHMPKEVARIWLEVESVRVERLQDISEEDAVKEGIESNEDGPVWAHHWKDYLRNDFEVDALLSFQTLWQSINGPESWAQNPWVWCVSFKVISKTGKP